MIKSVTQLFVLVIFTLILVGCSITPGNTTGNYSSFHNDSTTNTNDDLTLSVTSYPRTIVPGTKAGALVSFSSNPDISSSDITVIITNNFGTEVSSYDMEADVEWFSDRSSGTITLDIYGDASYNSYTFTVKVDNGYDREEVKFTTSTSNDTVTYSNSIVLGSATPSICTTWDNSSNRIELNYNAYPPISSDSVEISIFDKYGERVYSSFELSVDVEWFFPDTVGTIRLDVTGYGYDDSYSVKVKVVNGDVFDITTFSVITGSSINDTGFTRREINQYIYDIDGSRAGAYDLILGVERSYYDSSISKDLIDISDGELGITGTLSSANGAHFGLSILDFDSATEEEVITEADSYAIEESSVELLQDDVIIIKLGNNRGYVLLKILEVQKSSIATGSGFIRFDYKLIVI